MENIFENAYFGKMYKTRDERKAVLYSRTGLMYGFVIIHEKISDMNHAVIFEVDSFGEVYHENDKGTDGLDIISEWQEIGKEELDKLAKEYMAEERKCIIKGGCDLSFYDLETAFKAGFCARGCYCKTTDKQP